MANKLEHLVKGVFVIAYTSKKRTSWIGPYIVEKVNPKGTVQLKVEGQNCSFTTHGRKLEVVNKEALEGEDIQQAKDPPLGGM